MDQVPPHILALDDDADIRNLLHQYLTGQDFRVSAVGRRQEMLSILKIEPVDLLLLDLQLPDEDGLDLARQVREISQVPILILSGRSDEADRVMGLELAADDYVTKPFSTRELLARIRALLRRSQSTAATPDEQTQGYRFAGWELNLRLHRLTAADGRFVPLTNIEFSLLCAFLSGPQRVLTRDQLLRKIELDPSNPTLLTTQRGAGYIFNSAVSVFR